jgi:predicted transcriptional regulator
MTGNDDDLFGNWRDSDPHTSEDAAKSFNASAIKVKILGTLKTAQTPLNGWELAQRLGLPTITVVPRLAPMRRDEWIEQAGLRPGPSNRQQIAYIITVKGREIISK